MGIRIHGITANEYTATGDAWNYIIPQKFTVHTPVCVFESTGDEGLMATWEVRI